MFTSTTIVRLKLACTGHKKILKRVHSKVAVKQNCIKLLVMLSFKQYKRFCSIGLSNACVRLCNVIVITVNALTYNNFVKVSNYKLDNYKNIIGKYINTLGSNEYTTKLLTISKCYSILSNLKLQIKNIFLFDTVYGIVMLRIWVFKNNLMFLETRSQ